MRKLQAVYLKRYLDSLSIEQDEWIDREIDKLELTILAKAPKKNSSLTAFSGWLRHMLGESVPEQEATRLWNRWKSFFVDSDLDSATRKRTILERDKYRCRYCFTYDQSGKSLHEHHVFPRARGGAFTLENLAIACKTCNLGIGNQIVLPPEWVVGIHKK